MEDLERGSRKKAEVASAAPASNAASLGFLSHGASLPQIFPDGKRLAQSFPDAVIVFANTLMGEYPHAFHAKLRRFSAGRVSGLPGLSRSIADAQ